MTIKILLVAVLLLGAAAPGFAQAPNTNRLIPGPGITINGNTIAATQSVFTNIQNGGAAIPAAAAGQFVLLGPFTYTLAAAGSSGFPTSWGTCVLNTSNSGNATINATTSTFVGATYTTTLILAPGGWACPTSDGTNYQTSAERGNPVVTNSNTSYTFTLADCGTTQLFTSNAAVAVTLPTNPYPSCSIDVVSQNGLSSQQITFSGTAPNPISFDSYTKVAGPGAGVTLRVISNVGGSAAQWYIFGRGA